MHNFRIIFWSKINKITKGRLTESSPLGMIMTVTKARKRWIVTGDRQNRIL